MEREEFAIVVSLLMICSFVFLYHFFFFVQIVFYWTFLQVNK